jgi:hypothetical protein
MIDLSLPNEFYKNIKEVAYEPEMFLNDPATIQLIQNIADTDKSKCCLEALEKDWKGDK